MKKKGKRPIIILIVIICVLGAAVFALLRVLTHDDTSLSGGETADVLYDDPVSEPEPALEATPAPTSVPVQDPAQMPPPTPPDISAYRAYLTGDDYTTVRMSESDIHTGYLLLVNNNYSYDIPDDLDLVTITSTRNSAYRVNSVYSKLRHSIMNPLNDMMQSFADEAENTVFGRQNAYMYIISAYRDLAEQRREFNDLAYLQGYSAAVARAKQPGHSEHHTGLAFDLATVIDGVQHPFDYFDVTKWFARNSYKYGFILRYASNKTAITKTIYEPWHYRYVGLPHSYIMHEKGWALEEYIEKIKEYTVAEPLTVNYNGVDYEIFFTGSADITVPAHASREISGNNVDGYIVTIYERYDRLTNVSSE